MTQRIAYSGSVEPAVWLSFKGGKVPGAHASANDDLLYEIRNECLWELQVQATTPTGTFTILRSATSAARRFDTTLDTYTTEPIGAAALNAIFDAKDAGTLTVTVTVKVWFHKFFYQLLKHMTRNAGDTRTLARPVSPSDVEGSFTYRRTGSSAVITQIEERRQILNIPAMLSGWDIVPRGAGAPAVKLYIYLKTKEALPAADRDENALVFLACDYTKLARYGGMSLVSPAASHLERVLTTWYTNVWRFLLNYTSLARGERIRTELVALGTAALGGTQAAAVQAVRDAVDARMVTANHWGDRREDWTSEQLQKKLSDLFGGLHQSHWISSPVSFSRGMGTSLRLSVEEKAALSLQFGAGHCGEHARVSFSVTRSIMASPAGASKFVGLIWSGNYNVDHAFCVGGFRATTTFNAPDPVNAGSNGSYFNLRAHLAANPGIDGFVLDPYLDPTAQPAKASDLLAKIDNASRGGRRTKYLAFIAQHPTSPAATETPVTTLP